MAGRPSRRIGDRPFGAAGGRLAVGLAARIPRRLAGRLAGRFCAPAGKAPAYAAAAAPPTVAAAPAATASRALISAVTNGRLLRLLRRERTATPGRPAARNSARALASAASSLVTGAALSAAMASATGRSSSAVSSGRRFPASRPSKAGFPTGGTSLRDEHG
jgi:hypothetical protein